MRHSNSEKKEDANANTMAAIRQAQVRIENLWRDFVSSSLVNNGTAYGGSHSSDASFSIEGETRRLRKIEDALRSSLEQVILGSASVPPALLGTNNHVKITSCEAADRSSNTIMTTTDSPGVSHNDRCRSWDSFSNASRDNENVDGMSTVNIMSHDVSSLSNDDSSDCFLEVRRLRSWHSVVSLAEALFGNDAYYIISIYKKSPRMLRRSYQGSGCFFLVVSMIAMATFDMATFDPGRNRAAVTWLIVSSTAALTCLVQVYLPHSIDEVSLAFTFLLVYHVSTTLPHLA